MTSGQERSTGNAQHQASYDLPHHTGEHSHSLSLTVLFTSASATLIALRRAAQLAHQLGVRIRVLVAYVVPYPLPIDEPRVDPEFRLRQLHTFCEREPIEIQLDVRLCRDARACIHDALLPHSLIVIGGRQSWWPMAFEKGLARNLTRSGHQVVFVSDRGTGS